MLQVLMTILSAIGIVLLILLAVLLFLVLAILFMPFVYRGRVARDEGSLEAAGSVSWMFRLVYIKMQYLNKKPELEIYILGIPILKLRSYLRKPGRGKTEISPSPQEPAGHRKPTATPAAQGPFRKQKAPSGPEREPGRESQEEKGKTGPGRLQKIWFTIQNMCAKIKQWHSFIQSDTFKEAFRVVREKGKRILKHVLPGKVKGYIKFGMSDPAATGQLLGGAALLLPLIPEKLQIIPDFENQVLEADVTARGRIVLFVLLVNGLAVYRNPAVRKVIMKFQRKEA